MFGQPKYKIGDALCFSLPDGKIVEGTVVVVDRFGTFEDSSDVSYDVWVESENMLYKHVLEQYIKN